MFYYILRLIVNSNFLLFSNVIVFRFNFNFNLWYLFLFFSESKLTTNAGAKVPGARLYRPSINHTPTGGTGSNVTINNNAVENMRKVSVTLLINYAS